MATIVTRAGKGAALTHTEMDANFNNINTDKLELSGGTMTGQLTVNDAGGTDLVVAEAGVDKSSASTETFNIQNSGAGKIILQVDGVNYLSVVYPVGSIYMNASVATNPATLLGFGTWSAFGAGKVPVGLDSGDTDFDVVEETGGSKTHVLTTAEMASHDHGSGGGHTHTLGGDNSSGGSDPYWNGTNNAITRTTSSDGAHTHTSVGSNAAHTIVQPYIVVYMWKRDS